MINLLPPEGHRAVKQEYFYRAGASLLLLFSFIALFLTMAFIPTYVLVGAQIKGFIHNEMPNLEDTQTIKGTEDEMKDTEDILKQLSKTPVRVTSSEIVEEIQKTSSPAISFKAFRIQVTTTGSTTIQVQGIAQTRESLAHLKSALEASPLFERAEVPISDLARETDLPFMLTVTPKQKS